MSGILSFVGWAILPNYATSLIQNFYYSLTIRVGDPRPQPGSPRFQNHRRRIFILVVTLYLFYTIYESFYEIHTSGDFYSALGVSPLADERTIKSRFRRLAAQHHPDKINQQAIPTTNGAAPDDFFVYLKLAQDTLLDPARRFAYDRFGPQVNEWRNTRTVPEFLYEGLKRGLAVYIGGLGTILVLNFFYWSSWGRFWRFYTFAALVVLELVLVTRPVSFIIPIDNFPTLLQPLLGLANTSATKAPALYILPYQIISLARRMSITVHIFISQITPLYVFRDAVSGTANGTGALSPQTIQGLGKVAQLSRVAEIEVSRLLELTMTPFRGDPESVTTLRRGMKEGLVLGSIRNTPEVQEAVAQAARRRKAEGVRSTS